MTQLSTTSRMCIRSRKASLTIVLPRRAPDDGRRGPVRQAPDRGLPEARCDARLNVERITEKRDGRGGGEPASDSGAVRDAARIRQGGAAQIVGGKLGFHDWRHG